MGLSPALRDPGGNITGLATLGPEISGKHLELLKETVPMLSRVAVLGTSTVSGYSQTITEIERAAKAFSVELQYLDVLDSQSIETALRAANKGVLKQFSRYRAQSFFLSEKRLWTSR